MAALTQADQAIVDAYNRGDYNGGLSEGLMAVPVNLSCCRRVADFSNVVMAQLSKNLCQCNSPYNFSEIQVDRPLYRGISRLREIEAQHLTTFDDSPKACLKISEFNNFQAIFAPENKTLYDQIKDSEGYKLLLLHYWTHGEFICSVTLGPIESPLQLPCNHFFSREGAEGLTKHLKSRGNRNKYEPGVECPICRCWSPCKGSSIEEKVAYAFTENQEIKAAIEDAKRLNGAALEEDKSLNVKQILSRLPWPNNRHAYSIRPDGKEFLIGEEEQVDDDSDIAQKSQDSSDIILGLGILAAIIALAAIFFTYYFAAVTYQAPLIAFV